MAAICRDPLETVAAFLKRVSEEQEQDYEGAKVVRRRGDKTT